MKKFKYPFVILIILFQFFILFYMVISQENILKKGKAVYLKIVPIDPRSLMQGDYVILNYNISRLNINAMEYSTIYLVLRKNQNGYYEFSRQYKKSDELNENEIMIKGQKIGDRINYGIESYFVEEGTGLEVERKAKYAKIKIDKNGNAKLVELLEKIK